MIDPTPGAIKQFLTADDGQPFAMLNLLRFVDGGAARYADYLAAARPFVTAVGGELIYGGTGNAALIAEAGQAWDAVLIVRYPNRSAFLRMVMDPGYQAITHLRTAALHEAVLQPTTPWS